MYRFPRTLFVNNGLFDQVKHVRSEAFEAVDAYMKPDIAHLAEELFDVIHSAETGLRILDERYEVDLIAIEALVLEKNARRGYYKLTDLVETFPALEVAA